LRLPFDALAPSQADQCTHNDLVRINRYLIEQQIPEVTQIEVWALLT